MSDHSPAGLSIDISPLRPAPGAVHVATGLPDGLEDRVMQWLLDNGVIGAVDFWRQENDDRDPDGPVDADLYLVVATDGNGAVQVRGFAGELVAGAPLQELRWRMRADLGVDDVVFDDWEGAALWNAHDPTTSLSDADGHADRTDLPVPEHEDAEPAGEPVPSRDAAAESEDDWAPERWNGVEEPAPQHVLAFSRRGTAHGHLLAAQAHTTVQTGHRDGWSVFRYTSVEWAELTPPRKADLPAITVRYGHDDLSDAWVEIDTHGDRDHAGFGLWPAARSAMRPVFALADLDSDAGAVQARVLDESLDPESDLHLLAADEVMGEQIDLARLYQGVAPHPAGAAQRPAERVENVLIGLGLPAELVTPAVHGEELPDQLEFSPAHVMDAVLQTVAAGRAGLRPIGEPLSTWDAVEQRVRRDPKWAAGLVSTELVLGVAALLAGRKLGRRSRTAGGLLTVLGVTALADAVFESFLTQVRRTSGQPFDYRGASG